MSLTQLSAPYPVFTDLDGTPLDGGYLYFGEVDDNPESNPITVYYDRGLTQPALQPVRTINGQPSRDGAACALYANAPFSLTVRNKAKELVIYAQRGYGIAPGVPFQAFDNAAKNVPALIANTSFVYDADIPNTIQVAVGDILRTLAEGFAYEVAASGATDQHVTTAGGVKLYVLPTDDNYIPYKAFGSPLDGITDETATFKKCVTAALGRTIRLPRGRILLSEPVYLGPNVGITGVSAEESVFVLSHSGVGIATKLESGQTNFTQSQVYENFSIEANASTTYAFWVVWALYCEFKNISVFCPNTAGSNYVGFRIGGRVYLNTFTNCVSDVISGSTAHGGRGWWIGNGMNEESFSLAATNNNNFITCRGLRANIGIDIDAANGCNFNAPGAEVCTSANIRLAGNYNTLIDPWIEVGRLQVDEYVQANGSGGFLAAAEPSYNTIIPGYPIATCNVEHGRANTFVGGRINVMTIDAPAFNTNVQGTYINTSLTDNGRYSNLQYFLGGIIYRKVKGDTAQAVDEQTASGVYLLNLYNGDFIRSHAFQEMQIASARGLHFSGAVPTLTANIVSTAPGAPAADRGRLYFDKSGGKVRLMVRFPTGAAQQIAIEP